jgi:hypothetical protein
MGRGEEVWGMNEILEWFLNNWKFTVPIILSLVAIVFTAFKDFIIPYFLKPKLEISYYPKEPYKRSAIIINSNSELGTFDRFKVENIGSEIAKGCRCQIYSIKNNKGKKIDLKGFPLMWASRPDSAENFIEAERLNISQGETEFVDLVHTQSYDTTKIFFNSYHNVPIGMANNIPIGEHIIKVIISGENFKPYIVSFKVFEKLDFGGFHIKLLNIKRK